MRSGCRMQRPLKRDELIKEFDLAGVAEWKIGFESGTDIWNTISSYLQ